MICNKCRMNRGFSGQGFRQWICKGCGKEFWHHNTAVPMYCPECSEKLHVCEECGEKIVGERK